MWAVDDTQPVSCLHQGDQLDGSATLDPGKPQAMLGAGGGAHAGMCEPPDHRGQIEATIDAALRLGQVAAVILFEVGMIVGAGDRLFEMRAPVAP